MIPYEDTLRLSWGYLQDTRGYLRQWMINFHQMSWNSGLNCWTKMSKEELEVWNQLLDKKE